MITISRHNPYRRWFPTFVRRGLMFFLFFPLGLALAQDPPAPKIPPWDVGAWVLTVAGQTIQANPDGSFFIPNVTAPDLFGPGGPGTRPDFLSDDFVQLTGVNTSGDITWYCYSNPFRIRSGETFFIDFLTFTPYPPPVPESIIARPEMPTLTQLGQTTQVRVIAKLSDGRDLDVSHRSLWTIYRTSNPNIATVDPDGVVTAVSEGMAYITASNTGVTTVTQVDIVEGSPLTTIVGLVLDEGGNPVPGINVTLVGVAGSAETDENGIFEIVGVTTEFMISGILARGQAPGGGLVFGRITDPIMPVPNGITDVGSLIVMPCSALVTDCTDTDNDCIPDQLEVEMRLNPNSPDSDNDGIPDGQEDTDGDGFLNCDEVVQGTHPGKRDTDNDGVSDSDEINRFGTDPANPDSDYDGLIDGQEFARGTNPLDWDTDDDGFDDNSEIIEGMNPLAGGDRLVVNVASMAPSFLNTMIMEAPSEIVRWVTSENPSYLNAQVVAAPPNVDKYSTTTAISFLNGVGIKGPSDVNLFSPSISYENQ